MLSNVARYSKWLNAASSLALLIEKETVSFGIRYSKSTTHTTRNVCTNVKLEFRYIFIHPPIVHVGMPHEILSL